MMRHLMQIVESARLFDPEKIVANMETMDGKNLTRQLYRIDRGTEKDHIASPLDASEDDADFDSWFRDWALERIEEKYHEIARIARNGKMRLYRVITAPANWQPDPNRHPGVYWSWDEDAAEAHWGDYSEGNVPWLITADVEIQHIDWETTLAMNADFSFEDEKEVRVHENCPLIIISIEPKED